MQYINFQWKKGHIPLRATPHSFWKKQQLVKSQKNLLTDLLPIIQWWGRDGENTSNVKKKSELMLKSPNVDLFRHGDSQILKVNELTVKAHAVQCICIPPWILPCPAWYAAWSWETEKPGMCPLLMGDKMQRWLKCQSKFLFLIVK